MSVDKLRALSNVSMLHVTNADKLHALGSVGVSHETSVDKLHVLGSVGMSHETSVDKLHVLGSVGMSHETSVDKLHVLGSVGMVHETSVDKLHVLGSVGMLHVTSAYLPTMSSWRTACARHAHCWGWRQRGWVLGSVTCCWHAQLDARSLRWRRTSQLPDSNEMRAGPTRASCCGEATRA